MKEKILITAANHSIAYLMLHLVGANKDVLLTDVQHQELLIPSADSSSYAHELLSFCLNKDIQQVIPLRKKEVEALAEAKVLFAEYGIELLIPDLLQLKALKNLKGENVVESFTVEDFNSFSKMLLQLGYPERFFCFGDAGGNGNLILIDDTRKYHQNVWVKETAMPFISIGKFLNTGMNQPINIYVLEQSELTKLSVFYDGIQLLTVHKIDKDLQKNIKTLLDSQHLKGFYEFIVSGTKIVRIKPNTV